MFYSYYITAVPTVKNDPNRIMVIGNMLGQIGVITWNGYEPHQKGQNVEGATYQHIRVFEYVILNKLIIFIKL